MRFNDYIAGLELLEAAGNTDPAPETFGEWWEACLQSDNWHRARKTLKSEWAKMLDGKEPFADRGIEIMSMDLLARNTRTPGEEAVSKLYSEATKEFITAPTMRYCRDTKEIIIGAYHGGGYPMCVEDLTTGFALANTLAHLSGKSWFSPSIAGDLVLLLRATGILPRIRNNEWRKRNAA